VTDGPVLRPADSILSRRSRKVFTKITEQKKIQRFARNRITAGAQRPNSFFVIFVKIFLLLREKNHQTAPHRRPAKHFKPPAPPSSHPGIRRILVW
jgi:hypothetical protein